MGRDSESMSVGGSRRGHDREEDMRYAVCGIGILYALLSAFAATVQMKRAKIGLPFRKKRCILIRFKKRQDEGKRWTIKSLLSGQ